MAPGPYHFEWLLFLVISQLLCIIAVSSMVASLFQMVGQPRVCGEMAAGLILGPSVFGFFFPHLQPAIFRPDALAYINILAQVGLIFLMFLIGLEFDFGQLRGHGHKALTISFGGIVTPFALGMLLALWMKKQMHLAAGSLEFSLFVATALSITALPVLGRIMIEFNIHRTRLGVLTISASAADDAIAWLLLAALCAIVRLQFQPMRLAIALLGTVAYVAVMVFAVGPLLAKWVRRVMKSSGGELSLSALAQLLVLIFASSALSNLIGIFSLFGAFLLGAVLHDQSEFREAVNRRMHDFVVAFFVPVFFAYTGLRTDIGGIGRMGWLICLVIIATACLGKFGGCTLASRLCGLSWRDSCSVGIMMNTRALTALIVLNTGFELGIISRQVFSMLVVMAVATTYMASPLLRRLIQGSELQPYFEASAFHHRRQRLRAVLAISIPSSNLERAKAEQERA